MRSSSCCLDLPQVMITHRQMHATCHLVKMPHASDINGLPLLGRIEFGPDQEEAQTNNRAGTQEQLKEQEEQRKIK